MSETAFEKRAGVKRPRPRAGDDQDVRVLDRVARQLQDVSRHLAEQYGWASDGGRYCDRAGHWPVEDFGREVVLTESEILLPRLCTVCGDRLWEARALFVHD